MKTNRTLVAVAVLLGLLLSQDAHAFYNPSTGRWLSRDPIGESEDGSLYASVANSPVQSVDALGQYRINNVGSIPQGTVQRIRGAVDGACGQRFSSLVTASAASDLHCCIRKLCRNGGTVELSSEEPMVVTGGERRRRLGQANCFLWGRSATLYLLNGSSNTDWGAIVIHEFAHCCGWVHGMPGLADKISDGTI